MPESHNERALDLVLVGAISKDENIYAGRKESSIGGAVTYGAFSAKRSGSKVGIITKLAQEDHHLLDQFCDEQIPVWVFPAKKTTAIRNVYHASDKECRTCTCLAATDAFFPENLPPLSTKIIHAAALIKGEITSSSLIDAVIYSVLIQANPFAEFITFSERPSFAAIQSKPAFVMQLSN